MKTKLETIASEMKKKTANEIIAQSKRMFARLDKTAPDYSEKLHKIAEIGRGYLHNIAYLFGMRYGTETWARIGSIEVTRKQYAGY